MRILLVVDDYFNHSNGLSISTQRFKNELKKMGQEVKVLSAQVDDNVPDFALPVMHIPLIDPIVTKEGFHFAKPVKEKLLQAISWANIVHLETPFPVSIQAGKIAKKMDKAVIATMHIYPENGTSSIPLFNQPWINSLMMKYFRDVSFKNCSTIICPTAKVKKRLEQYHFKQNLVVISNGISDNFLRNPHYPWHNRPFTVISIGRFSREKDQVTLFKALPLVKHIKKMRIVLAGKGPLRADYQKLAKKMPIQIEMHYFSPHNLQDLMSQSDLIVHCAKVEVEGMACMEAFAAGVVPLIATSPLSSTASYSLSENNQFPAGDYQKLAQLIDFWYEHPEFLEKMSEKYRKFAQNLTIKISTQKLIKVYRSLLN